MVRNVIGFMCVDWWDVARCVYLEMDRIYFYSVSFVKPTLKHILVFLKYFVSQFGIVPSFLANPFFGCNIRLVLNGRYFIFV